MCNKIRLSKPLLALMVMLIVVPVSLSFHWLWQSAVHIHANASIHEAIEYSGDDPSEVQKLLEAGADVDYPDPSGYTPLMNSIAIAQMKTFKLLLKRGANVNAIANDGTTPLIEATLVGQPEMVRELLIRGANRRARDKSGMRALDWARGNAKQVRRPDPEDTRHEDYPLTLALLRENNNRP